MFVLRDLEMGFSESLQRRMCNADGGGRTLPPLEMIISSAAVSYRTLDMYSCCSGPKVDSTADLVEEILHPRARSFR